MLVQSTCLGRNARQSLVQNIPIQLWFVKVRVLDSVEILVLNKEKI
jgi:hypothetical protein